VTQRTRAYQSNRSVQRGVLAGLTFKRTDLTTYLLNPDQHRPNVIVAVAFHF
jgi:hypothetical protein